MPITFCARCGCWIDGRRRKHTTKPNYCGVRCRVAAHRDSRRPSPPARCPTMPRIGFLLIAIVFVAAACGGQADDEESGSFSLGRWSAQDPAMAPAAAPPPAAKAAPAPRFVERLESEAVKAVSVEDAGWALTSIETEGSIGSPLPGQTVAQLVTQERIIIRTVDMAIVVTDIQNTTDAVSTMAQDMGGWVVSSNRFQKHRGFVSFRVPSGRLDEAIGRLRDMAVEVKSEVSDSRDVTDEYFDLKARLDNQEATETALVRLLDRAETVEDALKVQQALTGVREEVERLQGRIKLLEETSAFSLVRVTLELRPHDMAVDEVLDKTAGVGESVRFRAFFKPPEGIEDFFYTWDFGDGVSLEGHQTAPTEDKDTRVTATVTHIYRDERDSPFIVQFEINGSGEAGAAEGETTLMVNVTKVPEIVVFAGESMVVEQGEEIEFSGSFTRPQGLGEVKYTWDFGDGAKAANSLAAGVTNVVATHIYKDDRPFPYSATLTITAPSEAGDVEGVSSVNVLVTEAEGWVIAGWSATDQGKTAVRTLSGVGLVAVSVLIWVAILSPVWLIGGGVLVWVGRLSIRRWRRRAAARDAAQVESDGE